MKMIATFLAGLVLTGGAIIADEQAGPAYDPESAGPAPPEGVRAPGVEHLSAETPEQAPETIRELKEDFIRKVVITVEGDEIGVIRDVGYSAAAGEPVAVVDVDAYIGIGEKQIAIPLSQFEPSDTNSDSVTTTLTRQGIEAAREFSDADFTPAE